MSWHAPTWIPKMALTGLAATVLLGCGGSGGGGGDAGAPDGSEDATSSHCTTGAECDDGLFCNGAEGCDPDDPGADTNGCVPGERPCPTNECDEAGGSCTTDCADADADGDGSDSMGCGGDDCDDRNPARFPGNLEVCDAEGLDEDCDPSTIGRDVDGDGFFPTRCCNLQPDASLLCGEDCDDDRATVNPSAVDSCNGVDDDCNGTVDDAMLECVADTDGDGFGTGVTQMVCVAMGGGCPAGFVAPGGEQDCDDENDDVFPGATEECNGVDDDCANGADDTFDCVQDSMATGTNHCGRTGTRTCSGTCEWNSPDFIANETSGTCDYCCDECDSTGSGIAAEQVHATDSTAVELDPNADLYGDAAHFSGAVYFSLNQENKRGSVFTDGLVMGHDGAVFDVVMRVTPAPGGTVTGEGWALVLLDDEGTNFLGNGGNELAVPRDRNGIAAEWRFYREGNPGVFSDSIVVRRLDRGGSDPIIVRDDTVEPDVVSGGSARDQRLRMTITPDTIGTPEDETTLSVEFLHSVSTVGWVEVGRCANEGATGCGITVTPGETYFFGASGSTSTKTSALSLENEVRDVEIEGLCP